MQGKWWKNSVIDQVGNMKTDLMNCQQKQLRMREIMNTYDKLQDMKTKDVLKIKKQWEENKKDILNVINEVNKSQENVSLKNTTK